MFDVGERILDIIGDIFAWIYESLVEPFIGISSFGNLIYGTGRQEDLIYRTFSSTEITDIYEPGILLMSTIAGFFILAAIILAGMRMSSTVINPGARTYYIEFLKDLGIVAILFFNIDFLYDMVFTLNNGIIGVFQNSQDDVGGIIETVNGTGIIGAILVAIILLFLTLWANWYYMMRKLTLLILMILGPLMLALFLIPQFKGITGAWFKELVGTVFVQSIHAILFWMITLITAGNSMFDPDGQGAWGVDWLVNIETVILYLIFIPVGESVRSLLGMGGGMSTGMSKAGAMFGMSALAGVYGSVKGALDKDNGSVMNSLRQAKDGVHNANKGTSSVDEESTIRDATMAANTGTDSGTTPKADAMLKWGDIGSRAGKAVLGSAGSVGGTAIGGPMGSMIGATAGFAAGGVAGGLAGRGAKAGKDFAANRLNKGTSAFHDTFADNSDPLNKNKEDLANTLADKETADYENENKSNFLKDAQEKFPNLDEKGLDMKWEEHKSGIHEGNLKKAQNLVKNVDKNDGKLADASKLADESASEMTNQWADNNKESFDNDFDKENPLPADATQAEKLEHTEKKEKAWNQKLASQKGMYQDLANKTSEQLKDASMGNHMVSQDEFGKQFANNMEEQDKNSFIGAYQKEHPNATLDEAKDAFAIAKGQNTKEGFTKKFMEQNKDATVEQAEKAYDDIQNAHSKDDYINQTMDNASKQHEEKADKTYNLAQSHIENDNDRDGFIQNYQTNIDPSASDEKAGAMYDSVKDSDSKQTFMQKQPFMSNQSMKKQAGNDYELAKQGNQKEAFMQAYQASNPKTSPEQAEKVFNDVQNASSKDDYINKTMDNASKQHKDRTGKTYDVARSHIENDDKDGFIQNYQTNIDPSASNEQAEKVYDSVKDSRSKQAFMKTQQFTPTDSMKQQAGSDYDLGSENNKERFVQSYQANNPNAAREQAESLYDKANVASTGNQQSYANSAKSAIQNVKPEAVFNKGANQSVDRGYFSNQLANAQTLTDKSNFINSQLENGLTESEANTKWAGQEKQVFQDNLSHYKNQIPESMPLNHAIGSSKGMQVLKAGGLATGAFVGQASGFTPIAQAVKSTAIKGSMVTQSFASGYSEGTDSVTQSPLTQQGSGITGNLVTQTKAIGSGISQGLHSAKESLQPAVETAVENQKSFQNAVAYTGGIVGGAKLYQKAGNLAARVSPYNKTIHNSAESGALETSEIRQMAMRKDDETGHSYIPQGNIKLVTTPNQSYVQAIDSAGQERVVSRYGAGDSALKDGQVTYQDLTIDDKGGFKPSSNSYQLDTGGNKVDTGRRVNINPNKLIATNRPNPVNPMVIQDVSPYNASVETGSFSTSDAMMNMDNIRTVVTKDRSYMVGQDKSSGEEVRISPYKQGDARLDINEIREVEYVVQNKRFNVSQITNNQGKKVKYEPPLDTDDYLHTPRNPRSQRRSQFENLRYKNIGGAE